MIVWKLRYFGNEVITTKNVPFLNAVIYFIES